MEQSAYLTAEPRGMHPRHESKETRFFRKALPGHPVTDGV